MYVQSNPKTKKALREALKSGETLTVINPVTGRVQYDAGFYYVEGPHFPQHHSWYAKVECNRKGQIIRIMA